MKTMPPVCVWRPPWTVTRGNFSGGDDPLTDDEGDSVSSQYAAARTHTLYVGTRYTGNGAHFRSLSMGARPARSIFVFRARTY